MNLRKYIAAVLVVMASLSARMAAQELPLLVDVPVPPAEIERLDERCNYIVDNFWKRLNFKGAFSSQDRMEATLARFFSVIPYATSDTVYMALDRLIGGVEKADAKNLLTLARMAERLCGSDTAAYASEELMVPFAQAVANSKKIKGPEKEYYAAMARRMSNSRRGVAPADFSFTTPGNGTGALSDITAPTVLLFFYNPDDFNSRMARTRLGNDFVVKTLTDHNLLKVVALYSGPADSAWEKDAESIPAGWVVGAAPGIDELFSIKELPQLYFLDENRIITDKDFSVDAAILYFGQFLKK